MEINKSSLRIIFVGIWPIVKKPVRMASSQIRKPGFDSCKGLLMANSCYCALWGLAGDC